MPAVQGRPGARPPVLPTAEGMQPVLTVPCSARGSEKCVHCDTRTLTQSPFHDSDARERLVLGGLILYSCSVSLCCFMQRLCLTEAVRHSSGTCTLALA